MIRRALIIECSRVPNHDYLPGAETDAANWNRYLPQNKAGAWERSEIVTLHNPTRSEALAEVARARHGYGFVAFSGHGYTKNGDTYLCMKDGDLSEYQLTPSAERATIILDSCRGDRTADFAESRTFDAVLTANVTSILYRNAFNNALADTEEGTIRIYGCSFNQAAQETKPENGGDFTHEFIKAGVTASSRVFTVQEAFGVAAIRLREKGNQQPEYKPGRRLRHFPFSVKI